MNSERDNAARPAYLIAGASGMLGTAMQDALAEKGLRYLAPAEADLDITDAAVVDAAVREFSASLRDGERGVLLNAAAYTNVEAAQDHPNIAFVVNEQGALNLAKSAFAAGLALTHISTDFIFDGLKVGAYLESDKPAPLSVYGASKLAGERAVLSAMPTALVVRTAWVFAASGVNFPLKLLAAARERGSLSVVTDEIGSPTYVLDLARGLRDLEREGALGVYHLTGSGTCSRYEFALELLEVAGLGNVEVEPVSSAMFTTKATRPANSVLDCTKAARHGVVLPSWQDAVARCFAR